MIHEDEYIENPDVEIIEQAYLRALLNNPIAFRAHSVAGARRLDELTRLKAVIVALDAHQSAPTCPECGVSFAPSPPNRTCPNCGR